MLAAAAHAWRRAAVRTAVRLKTSTSAKSASMDSASSSSSVEELAKRLGHRWKDVRRLESAVAHPATAANDSYNAVRFERFEFLGDRVLNLVVAEYLHETYPNEDEAAANLRLVQLVRQDALLAVGRGWQLEPHHYKNNGQNNGVIADTVESVVAAVFRDAGYEAARAFVRQSWAPLFAQMETAGAPEKDAKTRLGEVANSRGRPLPAYEVVARSGKSHDPEFTVVRRCPTAPRRRRVPRRGFASPTGRDPRRSAPSSTGSARWRRRGRRAGGGPGGARRFWPRTRSCGGSRSSTRTRTCGRRSGG